MKAPVVVVGGGGHARVVLDILTHDGRFEVAGFTSVTREEQTAAMFKCPYLGDDSELPALVKKGITNAFVAIGDNACRKACFEQVGRLGFTLINAISRDARISDYAVIGTGVAVMPGAIINAGSRIGDGVIVNTNASVDHDCDVGDFAHIAPGCVLAGTVSVGAGVLLGAGCRVIPGIRIGAGTVIGAGAAVIRDIPGDSLAVGVPARLRKTSLKGVA